MTTSLRTLALSAALLASASAFAAPATGEFSAADAVTPTVAAAQSRDAVRLAAREGSHLVNGEIVVLPEPTRTTAVTRAEVRAEGRLAVRTHSLPTGDLSL